MGLLRLIWKDILWLNSHKPAVKIAGLITAIVLIWGAWYLGTEWWNTKDYLPRSFRLAPRWEQAVVVLGTFFLVYMIDLIDRYRKIR
jgi:hypothetical protein